MGAVWKVFASLFWIQQVNIKNIGLKERETKKREKKRVLCDFEMPKLEEIFKKVVIVCHRYEKPAVLKVLMRLSVLLRASNRPWKTVGMNCLQEG